MIPHPIVCRPEVLDAAERILARFPEMPYEAAELLAADEVARSNTPRKPGRRTMSEYTQEHLTHRARSMRAWRT